MTGVGVLLALAGLSVPWPLRMASEVVQPPRARQRGGGIGDRRCCQRYQACWASQHYTRRHHESAADCLYRPRRAGALVRVLHCFKDGPTNPGTRSKRTLPGGTSSMDSSPLWHGPIRMSPWPWPCIIESSDWLAYPHRSPTDPQSGSSFRPDQRLRVDHGTRQPLGTPPLEPDSEHQPRKAPPAQLQPP